MSRIEELNIQPGDWVELSTPNDIGIDANRVCIRVLKFPGMEEYDDRGFIDSNQGFFSHNGGWHYQDTIKRKLTEEEAKKHQLM